MDSCRRGQGVPSIVGHVRGSPQRPEIRLRPVRRHPDVLRHRKGRILGELQGDVVPPGDFTNSEFKNDSVRILSVFVLIFNCGV